MKKAEIIQMKKNEALNEIKRIFSDKFKVSQYSEDGSSLEQRAWAVEDVLEKLDKEIKAIKTNPTPVKEEGKQ